MYVITIKGKPATLESIYRKENKSTDRLDSEERASLLCAMTEQGAIDAYLHHIGFSWGERPPGVGVMRCAVVGEPTMAAISNLLDEGGSTQQPTPTGVKRVVKSCKALGVEGPLLWRVLAMLDIANGTTGEPYSKRIPRTWS